MDVRPEIRMDARSIDEVHRLAFGGGDSEVEMVHELRESPAYLPELSLVAVEGGVIVGHILITVVHYVADDESIEPTPILSLAPLAVLPSRQNQGIGARLVDVGLRRASLRPEPFMVRRLPGFRPVSTPGTVRYYPARAQSQAQAQEAE